MEESDSDKKKKREREPGGSRAQRAAHEGSQQGTANPVIISLVATAAHNIHTHQQPP